VSHNQKGWLVMPGGRGARVFKSVYDGSQEFGKNWTLHRAAKLGFSKAAVNGIYARHEALSQKVKEMKEIERDGFF
jgi:hypothetical protein